MNTGEYLAVLLTDILVSEFTSCTACAAGSYASTRGRPTSSFTCESRLMDHSIWILLSCVLDHFSKADNLVSDATSCTACEAGSYSSAIGGLGLELVIITDVSHVCVTSWCQGSWGAAQDASVHNAHPNTHPDIQAHKVR
jgi:hypothetical protein